VTDLNAVAVFVGIVEAGSFTGGARAMGLPKGSVSRKISALEAALGVRLLNRTTRKLSLTDIGRTYYQQCRKGLDELEAAEGLVDKTNATPRGVLRISAPIEYGAGGLGDWVEVYLKRYEQAKVELVLSDHYVDLIDERIDLAFRSGQLQDSSFVATKLADAGRIVCASPGYLKRCGTPLNPGDLKNHSAVVYGSLAEGAVWHLRGPEGEIKVVVNARVAADSMSYATHAALSGLGVALLPEAIARNEIKAGRLKRVLGDYATKVQGFYAIYPSRRHMSVDARAFLDIVVASLKQQAPWHIADQPGLG